MLLIQQSLFCCIIFLFSQLSASCLAESLDKSQSVLRFDAGPMGSPLASGWTPLHAVSVYSADNGYGWTEQPIDAFQRKELSRSRTSVTIDGVTGKRLRFRADVKRGTWYIALHLGSERAGSEPLSIKLQGRPQQLGWQSFTPAAEPKSSLPRTCRIFQGIAHVEDSGLRLQVSGGEEDVRLLGISLVRQTDVLESSRQEFLQQLQAAGSHDSDTSLAELAKTAREKLNDPFFAYWHQQIELLAEAEKYFKMRGWQWANEETGMGMFDRLYQSIMLIDGLLGADTATANPLSERGTYLRGRVLHWLHREGAGEKEQAGARRDLERLYAKHPDDRVLAMYSGEKIQQSGRCNAFDESPHAPAWSIAQREALCRMKQIAHWWVEERQSETGEFGGKLGDDVELLRWWAPLVLIGDRTALRGWKNLADGVWQSNLTHNGYARKLADVEHAAEYIADTVPMLAVCGDSPENLDRLAFSARHFENLWTGTNQNGHRFFRSAWFSSTEIDNQPPKGRDVEYNTRAVQPMRYLAWRTQDPEIIELLHQWSLAWVSAALRTDKGKPKGIIPPSIRFSDEAVNGDEPKWYRSNMYWKYFDWEHHAGSLMLDQLLFTYALTKDERLLSPLHLTLKLIREQEGMLASNLNRDSLERGSRAWAATTLIRSTLFWNVVEQWRFLTDDPQWDDLILRHGTPYGRFRVSGQERYLVDGLEELLEGVRYNTPMMTSEAIHTDRVYVPRAELIKAMLTGDGVKHNTSPYHAVTWENTDESFTALVCEASANHLTVKAYNHSRSVRRVVMRLWQLEPGVYQLRLEPKVPISRKNVSSGEEIVITQSGNSHWIDLTGQQETTIKISQKRD